MSNLTDFFPSGGGGGLTPKFQEFNSSGTFTPTQALIDAGGYIEVFLVAAGGGQPNAYTSGAGGEVIMKNMYLNSTSSCSVTIGAGVVNAGGGNSEFLGSSAGGSDIICVGGGASAVQSGQMGAGFGSSSNSSNPSAGAGSGTLGYGAGGANQQASGGGGVYVAKANSGQGSSRNQPGGSGYCLIKWYE
jgi:hypothetical protein